VTRLDELEDGPHAGLLFLRPAEPRRSRLSGRDTLVPA
jgi:hypothetical protein